MFKFINRKALQTIVTNHLILIMASETKDVYTDEIDEYGTHHWYKNGELHSLEDKPAVIWANGNQEWFFEGKRHRLEDKPAIIMANGFQEWYFEGKRHRLKDKPAVIWADGTQWWYFEDKCHRGEDKPAIIRANGNQAWYFEGKLHRELGPAMDDRYFYQGKKYSRNEWLLLVTRSQRLFIAEWWEERKRRRDGIAKRDGNALLDFHGRLPRAAVAEVLKQISPLRH